MISGTGVCNIQNIFQSKMVMAITLQKISQNDIEKDEDFHSQWLGIYYIVTFG